MGHDEPPDTYSSEDIVEHILRQFLLPAAERYSHTRIRKSLDRTKEARDALLPVADKFPDDWRIAYQLACYCCRLGDRKQAWQWLERAIEVAGKVDIRFKALDEADLEAIWVDIAEI